MISIEDKIEIATKLQEFHYFFRTFWDLCDISIEDSAVIDTGAIQFNFNDDRISLVLNKKFWETENESSRMFLLCHEMLHVVLDHISRFREYWGDSEHKNVNYATDVVINEMLVSAFGFFRNELCDRLGKDGCWLDTVFKGRKDVAKGESAEYYFSKLKNAQPTSPVKTADVHIKMTEEEAQDLINSLTDNGLFASIDDEFIEKVASSPQEMQKLQQHQENAQAGSGGGSWTKLQIKKSRKKKWESVIKKWEMKTKVSTVSTTSRWDRIAPRYSDIMSSGKFFLPSDNWMVDEYYKNNKIEVFFFLDTSGSCYSLKDRFFKAAHSLDPKKFKIRLFSFDTRVEELDLKSGKVYGGGGTSFSIIENKIQSIIKSEKIKYPDAVWIITDGYGDRVNPEKPDKWHWFMTSGYSSHYIPKHSKIYKLTDYE